jgi:hypothetical protein
VLETKEGQRERRHDRLGFRGGWGFGLGVDNRLFFNVLQKSSSLGRLGPVVPTAFRLICAFSAYMLELKTLPNYIILTFQYLSQLVCG